MTETQHVETAPNEVHEVASSSQDFQRVYREYFAFVWSTLLRLGVPRPAIEDAVQDVFVVVHRRLSDFEGRGAGLRSWLFTIVRRVAYRHRRGMQRTARKHRALAQVKPQPMPVDEAVDQRIAAGVVMDALDQLDHDKRVALNLHVFEGLSGPQIAEELQINVDTAYSRIKAARRRLQRSLEASGLRGEPETWVEATRQQTRPPRGARRKVAAALALRWKSAPVFTGLSGLKVALLGVALGGVATVVVVHSRPEPTEVRTSSRPSTPATRAASAKSQTPETPSASPPPGSAPTVPSPSAGTETPVVPDARKPVSPRPQRDRAATAPAPIEAPETTAEARLAAEVQLLTRAKRALTSDPAQTLQLLATHAERFPRGQLATERAGYRAMALCALERWTQGRAEARLFVSAQRDSSLATRVATACKISETKP